MSADSDKSETTAEAVEKRYDVDLSGTVWTRVTVSAENEEAAGDAALELVKFAYYDWDDDPLYVTVETIMEVSE